MAPLSAPVGRASPSTFFPTPSQVSTHPITTVQSNNDYPPPPPHFEVSIDYLLACYIHIAP